MDLNTNNHTDFNKSNNNSVYANYEIYPSGKTLTPSPRKKFYCLPEIHGTLGRKIKITNAEFIDEVVRSNPNSKIIVVVEMVKSRVFLDYRSHEQTIFCKEKIEVMGWDLGASSEMLPGLSKEVREILKELEITIHDWNIKSYEAEVSGSDAWDYIFTMQNLEKKLSNQFVREGFEGFEDKQRVNEYLADQSDKIFKKRTESMINTMDKIIDLYDIIIAVAGETHFIPVEDSSFPQLISNSSESTGPEFCLDTLHEYLKLNDGLVLKHKNHLDTTASTPTIQPSPLKETPNDSSHGNCVYSSYEVYPSGELFTSSLKKKLYCLPQFYGIRGTTIRQTNAKLIDDLVRSNPNSKIIVLVESVKSGVLINYQGNEQTTFCDEKIDVMGWDLGSTIEMIPESSKEVRKIMQKLERTTEDLTVRTYGGKTPTDILDIFDKVQRLEKKCFSLFVSEGFEGFEDKQRVREYFEQQVDKMFQKRQESITNTIEKIIDLYDIVIVLAEESNLIPGEPTLHRYLEQHDGLILKHKNKADECTIF